MEKLRERNIETVKRFINLPERKDIHTLVDLFAEDGIQFNYFQQGMLPSEIRGKAALKEFWTPIPSKFSEMHFTIDTIFPMLDPNFVAVKFLGFAKLRDNQSSYNNEYFAVFQFNEQGQVKEYHEYSNPIITAKAFNMLDKIL